jgi:hypothetical protein
MGKQEEKLIGMDALIAAFQIFRKYGNPRHPTICEHDIMIICEIEPSKVSDEDKAKLEELGFFVSKDGGEEYFASYRYGSA